MSETREELIEDCVILFLGFVAMLVGMVDDFGTPRFNAGVGRKGEAERRRKGGGGREGKRMREGREGREEEGGRMR